MSTDRPRARTSADQLATARWRISSFSGAHNCVAVARLDDGSVAVRNSNHPEATALLLSADSVRVWIDGVKAGDLDGLS